MTLLAIDCEMSRATARALAETGANPILAKLAARVARRRSAPNPGGAAREADYQIRTSAGETIDIHLPAMRDGGRIQVVHHLGIGSLHSGRILRVPGTRLPETIMEAAAGRKLGELVDLRSTGVPELADALVTDVFDTDHRGQALLFHTDAATIRPTIETN